MRNWLHDKDTEKDKRVAIVHCKAGKGRSGTVACSYLISEEGWTKEDALTRFTARRMRRGFGSGVSIPSQLRWVDYIDRWTKTGKRYVERQIEVVELHVWGLRDDVSVAIEGYIDEGRTIKTFHVFDQQERLIIGGTASNGCTFADVVSVNKNSNDAKNWSGSSHHSDHISECASALMEAKETSSKPLSISPSQRRSGTSTPPPKTRESGGSAVVFRPLNQIVLPTSDICIDFERRNRATYGWTLVTAVAHVWFNAYFEGLASSTDPHSSPNGVFEIEWDAMDGIKGCSRKGTRALDSLAVVWRALSEAEKAPPKPVREPAMGEEVPQTTPADWKNEGGIGDDDKNLGLRAEGFWEESAGRAESSSA